MSVQLSDTLRKLFNTSKEEAWQNGWPTVPEWVFCSQTGHPLKRQQSPQPRAAPCLCSRRPAAIRIHDLRHTFASLLIQQGESLAYVKERSGTIAFQITVDIYGHLVPGGIGKPSISSMTPGSSLSATFRNSTATEAENAVPGLAVTVQEDYEIPHKEEERTSNSEIYEACFSASTLPSPSPRYRPCHHCPPRVRQTERVDLESGPVPPKVVSVSLLEAPLLVSSSPSLPLLVVKDKVRISYCQHRGQRVGLLPE